MQSTRSTLRRLVGLQNLRTLRVIASPQLFLRMLSSDEAVVELAITGLDQSLQQMPFGIIARHIVGRQLHRHCTSFVNCCAAVFLGRLIGRDRRAGAEQKADQAGYKTESTQDDHL